MKTANILSMGRFILASSLSVLPLAIASAAYAQNFIPSAQQTVTATVNGILQISVADTGFTADSTAAGAKSFTVNIRSNQKDGYEIKVFSANGGQLKNGDDGFDYSLTVGAAGTVTGGVKPGTDQSSAETLHSSTDICASDAGCNTTVFLNYDISQNTTLPGGTYTDTITYEVTAK